MANDIELELTTGPSSGEFITRVVNAASGGEPSSVVQLDVERLLQQRDALETTVLASAVSGRRVMPVHEQQLQRMGRALFDALFRGSVLGTYRASLGMAQQRGEPLRVVLRLTAPQLAALPWEALFDPETESYICRKEPLVRHVPAPYTRAPLEVVPPLRVLGLVASPRGMPALDVTVEQENLSRALAVPIVEGLIELEWLVQASWAAVQEKMLRNHWHVVHFIGHGDYDVGRDQGVIALVGENGRVNLVEAEKLADLLNEARPIPRLVVLNSCSSGEEGTQDLFSGTAAALVRSGISAVAAMQFTVSDSAAIAFARGFYTAIANGRSVDDAVHSGRISILGAPNSLEWVTPVLYVRGETTQLFSVAPAARKGSKKKQPERVPSTPPRTQPHEKPTPPAQPTISAPQLQAMYSKACGELQAGRYDIAIELLDKLLALDPEYQDAAAFRAEAIRQQDLADQYQRATDAQASGDWTAAARMYTDILDTEPVYRYAAFRRKQCETAQHIVDLQEEMRRHADAEDWHAVIKVSDELAALDQAAADPDGLATRARDAVRAKPKAALYLARPPLYSFDATPACALAWDPARARLAVATGSTWAYVDDLIVDEQNPGNAKLRPSLALQTGGLSCSATSVTFDRSGARIATGSQPDQACIWDASSGERLFELPHADTVWSVAFSPDGTLLATGSADSSAAIWDTSTAQKLLELTHGGPVWSVAFSPDGTSLATGSDDKKVRIWDARSGRLLLELQHSDAVNSVAFSPDGIRLATGSADGAASIWDTHTGRHLVELPHGDMVSSVAFSLDGVRLATGCQDGFTRIWDTSTAALLLESRCAVSVFAVAFSPDGRYLASAGGDVVRMWRDVNTL